MATRRAVANGNWSSTSTWNNGVVPGNGDTVYANGFNVTIDQDITIGGDNNPTISAGSFVSGQWYEITFVGTTTWTGIGATSNTAGTVFLATGVGSGSGTGKAIATLTTAANTPAGAAAGGQFLMSTVRAINTNILAGTTTCLNVAATSGTLVLAGLRVVGGTAPSAFGITCSTNSDLAACTFTGGNNSNAVALNNASTGTVTVSAACTFTGGNNSNAVALNNASTGTVTVTAACTFTGGISGGYALNNASTGTVTVSAACTFRSGTNYAYALNNASTGTVTVSAACTFTGGDGVNAVALNNASTGTVTVSAACTFTGGAATGAYALNNASAGTVIVTGSTFTASAFTVAANIPNATADVRLSGDFLDHWSGWRAVGGHKFLLGTTPTAAKTRYALNGTTGSYVDMFTADNSVFGQPATTDVRAGTVYAGGILTGSCAVPAAGSVALGVPVDNTTGTAALTPEAVWAHATRTLTAGAGITAADVWSHAARTVTGGTVDTLTNAPAVPSATTIAAAVRTELTELAHLDAPVSTRSTLTADDIPSSDIAAIKAKTDALDTERLAQAATTHIVGKLLEQL